MAVGTEGTLLAGRYRVLRRLGTGGMASVLLARDERLGRQVAVKRLHAESPEDVAARFEREARMGASLNHPGVVSVYDTVADDEGVLIVMEYVDGGTLRDVLAEGRLEPAQALRILHEVAAALDHAHAAGVIHRDVKPGNVLIARGGRVKLADLGIATAAEASRITHSGTVLGTAAYMAPERLEGEAGGPATDVYALAAVAFEMLSGERAFRGDSPIEIARRVVSQPPPDLTRARPGAPPAAAAALVRGLAKDPAARPSTAGELVALLTSAYERSGGEASGAREAAAAGAAAPADGVERDPAPAPEAAAEAADRAAGPVAAAEPRVAAAAIPPIATAARDAGPRPAPRRWVIPAAAAAAACAIAALVVGLAAGGKSARRVAGSHAPAVSRAAGARPAPVRHAAAATSPAAAAASGPAATLARFYTLATERQFAAAWALGTDRLHAQLASYDSFRSGEETLRSISFPTLTLVAQSATGATVRFASIAVHTDRTDHCSGAAALVRTPSGWRIDQLEAVICSGSAPAASPAPAPAPAGPPGRGLHGHGHGPGPGRGRRGGD